jgi:esterase/lipase superfamily enzyme
MRRYLVLLPVVLCVSVVSMIFLGGCQESLIPTPYVAYGEAGVAAFERVPERLRTTDIPVLYVTDRAAPTSSERGPEYTYARSPVIDFGEATVSLDTDATWADLVRDSTGARREHSYHPRVSRIERRGEIQPVMKHLVVQDGRFAPAPGAVEAFQKEFEPFDRLLDTYLDATDRKEVVLFIHGYNNTFDSAVLRLAQAWHFCARQGVPIVYTWPAGSGGLRGYAYDRESGEYTIVHLKVLLAALARNPKVEKVHIISHSRGTDVAVTALRELHAECRGILRNGVLSQVFGKAPEMTGPGERPLATRDILKLETLILAAPDLDLDVFVQRFFGENLLAAAQRTAIYFSEEDEAIGLADWLFRSRRRLGALQLADLTPENRALLAQVEHLQLINCKVTGATSHSYILQHPSALSDLILLLREQRPPGAACGRPLAVPFPGVWEMDNTYLRPTP